ncbi:hypothetical protein O6H91_07G075700 [Diphasiastrum complanatum]|uniref:Uncharacterized protein n=1 Tax=Diphasiastrum complanatum TaxID=34168 RepID=A0ACC2D775_DIPCM|nr:hypothetical protein O6H91_07G075700 [Diphasiastrum complanatum]
MRAARDQATGCASKSAALTFCDRRATTGRSREAGDGDQPPLSCHCSRERQESLIVVTWLIRSVIRCAWWRLEAWKIDGRFAVLLFCSIANGNSLRRLQLGCVRCRAVQCQSPSPQPFSIFTSDYLRLVRRL